MPSCKDIDFEYRQIVVRDGRGAKDRLHDADVAAGYGEVELPHALARKYPRAPCEWAWKFGSPARHGAGLAAELRGKR